MNWEMNIIYWEILKNDMNSFERNGDAKKSMRIGAAALAIKITKVRGHMGIDYPSIINVHEILKEYEKEIPLTWTRETRFLFEHRWEFYRRDGAGTLYPHHLPEFSEQFIEFDGKIYKIPKLD